MNETGNMAPKPQPENPQYVYNDAAKAAFASTGAAVPNSNPNPGPDQGYAQPQPAPATAQPAPAQPVQAAAQPAVGAANKKSKKVWIAVIVVLALLALCCFSVSSCVNKAIDALSDPFAESADIATDSVAVINLDGEIGYNGTACSPEGFKSLLDQAENNSHVKALVLHVNSGGGAATAGEEMASYLRGFSKPVVVSSASLNASAAYEISSQADTIYVAKSSLIGAIGTAMQMSDYSGLMDLLGIKVENITSAESKDSSYGTRPLTDHEREVYQHQVDQINEMFIQNVATGRNMTTDQVRSLATGMTFTGVDAVGNGLADKVGTFEDAIEEAANLAGVRQYEIAYLETESSFKLQDLLTMETNINVSSEDLAQALKGLS